MASLQGQQCHPGVYSLSNQTSAAPYPNQQQQMAPPQNVPQMMSPTKEPNPVTLCRFGQETVQELIQKISEVFQMLHRVIQLPNNAVNNQAHTVQHYQERKSKLDDQLRLVNNHFKKLHAIYDKIVEMSMQVDEIPPKSLIPLEGEEAEERTITSEYYYYASKEHKETAEQLKMKNEQLKEVIDQMRTIIWEINTMITMRKTSNSVSMKNT